MYTFFSFIKTHEAPIHTLSSNKTCLLGNINRCLSHIQGRYSHDVILSMMIANYYLLSSKNIILSSKEDIHITLKKFVVTLYSIF